MQKLCALQAKFCSFVFETNKVQVNCPPAPHFPSLPADPGRGRYIFHRIHLRYTYILEILRRSVFPVHCATRMGPFLSAFWSTTTFDIRHTGIISLNGDAQKIRSGAGCPRLYYLLFKCATFANLINKFVPVIFGNAVDVAVFNLRPLINYFCR